MYQYFSGKTPKTTTAGAYGGGTAPFSRITAGTSQIDKVDVKPGAHSRDIYEFRTFGLTYETVDPVGEKPSKNDETKSTAGSDDVRLL
jgi:hypothetical protein